MDKPTGRRIVRRVREEEPMPEDETVQEQEPMEPMSQEESVQEEPMEPMPEEETVQEQEPMEPMPEQETVQEPGTRNPTVEEVNRLLRELEYDVDWLPELGSVIHPITAADENPVWIPVGSTAWLTTLDQLRTHGYPLAAIDKFLMETADVINRDVVYSGTVTKEEVENFCMLWPHSSKQIARIRSGIDDLLADIRKQAGSPLRDPFAPSNDDEVREEIGKEPMAPPQRFDFMLNNVKPMPDLLRNWTKVITKVTSIEPSNSSVTYQCVPPGGYYNPEWIPEEYRFELETHYNFMPYEYIPPQIFNLLVSYLGGERSTVAVSERESNLVLSNNYTADTDQGLVTFTGTLFSKKMKHKPCMDIMKKDEHSLREVCDINKLHQLYPLLYTILNVEPKPKHKYFIKHPNAWDRLTYKTERGDVRQSRLKADAPYYLFRDFMLDEYAGEMQLDEKPSECLERFIRNSYGVISHCGLVEGMPKNPDKEYKKWLTSIFTFGGQEECPIRLKPDGSRKMMMDIKILKQASDVPTLDEISAYPEAIKRQMFKSLKEFGKSSFF